MGTPSSIRSIRDVRAAQVEIYDALDALDDRLRQLGSDELFRRQPELAISASEEVFEKLDKIHFHAKGRIDFMKAQRKGN